MSDPLYAAAQQRASRMSTTKKRDDKGAYWDVNVQGYGSAAPPARPNPDDNRMQKAWTHEDHADNGFGGQAWEPAFGGGYDDDPEATEDEIAQERDAAAEARWRALMEQYPEDYVESVQPNPRFGKLPPEALKQLIDQWDDPEYDSDLLVFAAELGISPEDAAAILEQGGRWAYNDGDKP